MKRIFFANYIARSEARHHTAEIISRRKSIYNFKAAE
jgi:hypothetical protein